MRAADRALFAFLCTSVGCFGGPTSDWPGRSTGDNEDSAPDGEESAGDDEDRAGGDPPKATDPRDNATDDSDGDDSKTPTRGDAGVSNRLDAGVSVPASGAQSDGGAASDAALSDADGSFDASGLADGSARSDASVPLDAGGSPSDASVAPDAAASDAGEGEEQCTLESDRRRFGACYGVYCGMTPDQMVARSQPAGACTSAAELTLACDGEIARVVSECAESNALMLGLGRSVARCAEGAESLSQVSAACTDCYVEEVLCAAQSCLAACLSSDTQGCTECRLSRCGADFRACSGLPAPGELGRATESR